MLRNREQKRLNTLDVIGAVVAAFALFCVTFVIVRSSGAYLVIASILFICVAFQLLEFIQNIVSFVKRSRIKKSTCEDVLVLAKNKYNI